MHDSFGDLQEQLLEVVFLERELGDVAAFADQAAEDAEGKPDAEKRKKDAQDAKTKAVAARRAADLSKAPEDLKAAIEAGHARTPLDVDAYRDDLARKLSPTRRVMWSVTS